MSLTDQIRKAETLATIDGLLAAGAKYTDASIQTRKKWLRVAQVRKEELTHATPQA